MKTKLQVIFCFLALLRPAILTCWSRDSYRMCQYTRNERCSRAVIFKISSNDPDFESAAVIARFDGVTREEGKTLTQDYGESIEYRSCTNGTGPTCKEAEVIILWAEKPPYEELSFYLYWFNGPNVSDVMSLSNLTLDTSSTTSDPTDLVTMDTTEQPGATDTAQGTTSDIPYTVAVAISAPVAILSTIAFFVTLIILILIVIRKSAPRYKAQK